MLKVHAFLVKLPHLSDAEFFAHWRHPHGTLTRRIPQFTRYVQNHGIGSSPAVPGFAVGPWLGMPAIWVDNPDALARAAAHPAYALLEADGGAFYDCSRLEWLVGRETIIARHAAGANCSPVKVMLLLKRQSAPLTLKRIAGLAETVGASLPGLSGISLTLPVDRTADAPCDAIIEFSFPDLERCLVAWGSGDEMRPVIAQVANLETSKGLLVREERVIWPDSEREGILA
jgi:hypothetical protein